MAFEGSKSGPMMFFEQTGSLDSYEIGLTVLADELVRISKSRRKSHWFPFCMVTVVTAPNMQTLRQMYMSTRLPSQDDSEFDATLFFPVGENGEYLARTMTFSSEFASRLESSVRIYFGQDRIS